MGSIDHLKDSEFDWLYLGQQAVRSAFEDDEDDLEGWDDEDDWLDDDDLDDEDFDDLDDDDLDDDLEDDLDIDWGDDDFDDLDDDEEDEDEDEDEDYDLFTFRSFYGENIDFLG